MLAVGLVGFLACLYGERLQLGRRWDRADFLFVPPFFLAPSFLVVFAYKLFRLTVWTKSGFTITKYGEWAELCLAFALCLFLGLNYRLLGQTSSSAPETSTDERSRAPSAHGPFWRMARRCRPAHSATAVPESRSSTPR
jgi:hypothetical protein